MPLDILTMFKITPAVLLGLAGSANAFWRMECPGRLDVARVDPIVNPNDFSAHAHTLFGSSGKPPQYAHVSMFALLNQLF